MSTCISGMEIYGDNDQWYYTPTSRCRDAGCMDCEDFTSMPSRKHQCMPCPFRDDCSFMRVDCEYDDQYDGSRFGKTDSDQYFSGMNRRHTIMDEEESVRSNSRASCMDRCQRREDDQMDCQRRCESEESMSGRGRDVYHNRDFYGNRDYHGHRNFYGNRDYYRHRNFYGNHNVYGHRNFHGNNFYGHHNFFGQGNFHGNSMNGEEYCESEFMLRNEESCKASSCCQWNTWEEGEASFNGEGRCWSDIGTKMCTDMFEGQGSYRNSYGNRDFYGNHNFYGHRKFHGNNFYGHRNSMNGEEYGVQRKCYNEYWQNNDCSGERSFHSIFRYDESTCISGMEIYGDDNQWYYTPTSRCRDAACMDCEDFTSMPSRKHQCMPCSFRDNCSFMRVDCDYDDEYDGSRFGKTDSDQYF